MNGNVAKEHEAVVKHSVSTGCGPSPPTSEDEVVDEVEETITIPPEEHPQNDVELEEIHQQAKAIKVMKVSTSVGTSPPPQAASTQVDELIINLREMLISVSFRPMTFYPLKRSHRNRRKSHRSTANIDDRNQCLQLELQNIDHRVAIVSPVTLKVCHQLLH